MKKAVSPIRRIAILDRTPIDVTDPAGVAAAIAASPDPVLVSLAGLRRRIPVSSYREIEAEVRARLEVAQ